MTASNRAYTIAYLPGDGIGPEVTEVARECVDAVAVQHGFVVEWRAYSLGARHYLATGEILPDTVLEELRKADAILLGAVGSPEVPPGVLERGLLLRLRAELDLYVNLRPSKLRPGVPGAVGRHQPADLDFVIVRENTEGLYAGAGGTVHRGTPFESATEESLNTRAGVERCVRYAADLATRRRGRLTLVHKNNVIVHAGHLWTRIFNAVATEYPEVTTDYMHVDAATIFLATQPERFDVIVTDNLFGDILTDLAAAISGGIGLAASGNVNPARTFPSMFEPVHGSAPDIAGTGKADPTAAILSAALLLDHLGHPEAAARIQAAVAADLVERAELGVRSTAQIGDAIRVRVAG